MIQMNFGSYKDYDMTDRFLQSPNLERALLDIGVYTLCTCYFMSGGT